MKRLLDLLVPEERATYEKSLDVSVAPTEDVRERTRDVRGFLEAHCWFAEEAEKRWAKEQPERRHRVLIELLWRSNCILDKSETAVIGLNKFNLGFGYSLLNAEHEGEDSFIIVV